jgi:hypothetical protein
MSEFSNYKKKMVALRRPRLTSFELSPPRQTFGGRSGLLPEESSFPIYSPNYSLSYYIKFLALEIANEFAM